MQKQLSFSTSLPVTWYCNMLMTAWSRCDFHFCVMNQLCTYLLQMWWQIGNASSETTYVLLNTCLCWWMLCSVN